MYYLHVLGEVGAVGKGSAADSAAVGTLPGVDALMLTQRPALCEAAVALVAREGSLTSVAAHVHAPCLFVQESVRKQ